MDQKDNRLSGNAYVYTVNHDEEEIDLGRLFAYILRRWKSIFLCCIVCAVALAGLNYAMNVYENANKYSDKKYNQLVSDLTGSEVQEVEEIYSRYQIHRNEIEIASEISRNSFLLQMDTDDIITYTVEYIFNTDHEGAYNSLESQTLGTEEYMAIAEALGEPENYKYVDSLVTLSGSVYENMYEVGINESYADSDLNSDGNVTRKYTGRLNVQIIGPTYEICEKMAEIVDDAIMDYTEKFVDAGGNISITQVDVNYVEGATSGVLSTISSISESISDSYSEMADLQEDYIDELSSAQTELFEFLLGRDSQEELEELEEDISISKTMVVIGAFLGFALMVFVYAMLYLLSGTIRSLDDVEKYTRKHIFGVFRKDPAYYRGIDGIFNKIADSIEFGNQPYNQNIQIHLVAEWIHRIAEKDGFEQVFIINEPHIPESESVVEKIEGCINDINNEQKPEIKHGNPACDPEALQYIKEDVLVIVVVTLNKTETNHLITITKLCDRLGTNIGGNIVVGEI